MRVINYVIFNIFLTNLNVNNKKSAFGLVELNLEVVINNYIFKILKDLLLLLA